MSKFDNSVPENKKPTVSVDEPPRHAHKFEDSENRKPEKPAFVATTIDETLENKRISTEKASFTVDDEDISQDELEVVFTVLADLADGKKPSATNVASLKAARDRLNRGNKKRKDNAPKKVGLLAKLLG